MTPKDRPLPPLFPRLFVACARGALVAIVLINVFYACGASGFSYGGQSFSFGREHDHQLFVIDEQRAFDVAGEQYVSISVVKYGTGNPFFRLCGRCAITGGIFPFPRYRKGPWLYTDMPWIKGPAAYNLDSGELVTLSVPEPKNSKIDPADVPFYAEHGFTFSASRKLDVDKVAAAYRPVTTVNEMCQVLEIAAYLIAIVLGLIALALLPSGLRRRRAARA
jgi:hypothetical protein